MKASYLLIGLVVLVAVAPQAGFAQCFCHWSYSSGQHIRNTNSGDVVIGKNTPESDRELTVYKNGANADVCVKSSLSDNVDFGTGEDGHYVFGYGSYPLYFATNGWERMRIDEYGRVGMGAVPTADLEVADTFSGGGDMVIIRNYDEAGDALIGFNASEGSVTANIGVGGYEDENPHFIINSGGAVDTALNEGGGDVGIGTAYPDGKLHVRGDDIVLGNALSEAQGRLFFEEHYNGNWGMSLVYNGDSTTWHSVPENCFGIVRHQDSATGSAALIVDRYSGNVGIGVTSPARTLHVKDVLRLEPQSSAPSGGKGDLYAGTDGKLYFHNGSAWKEVAFVP